MGDHDGDRLARGWDAAAAGYEAYFVPRFAPWVDAAVRGLTAGPLPDGPVLVPACGTFPELTPLAAALPGREIVGLDLSAGMVRRARQRAAGRAHVTVEQADAATLDPRWTDACAGVVSVFGLQQMPDPAAALRSWTAALRPGGRLSVVYWPPRRTETDGPFVLMSDLLNRLRPPADDAWEDELPGAVTAAGGTVESRTRPAYAMSHPSAAAYFDAATRSGAQRPLADERGPEFMAALRAEFVSRAPAGPWTHEPAARHLTARR